MDYKTDVPIIINSRDRVTPLECLVSWLLDAGYSNIMVLDNDSSYPPLIEYYDQIEGLVHVERLGKNLLSKALWCWPPAHQSIHAPFVYTDSDVIPTETCPHDVVEFLAKVAHHLGNPYKVGMSLKIDDLPDHYIPAPQVRKWEGERMWTKPIGELEGVTVYSAGVDTTFALYTEFRPFTLDAVRVGEPYTARHVDWYRDSMNPTEEQSYYEAHAATGCHSWGLSECFSKAVIKHCEG